jgi:hypothetical protein
MVDYELQTGVCAEAYPDMSFRFVRNEIKNQRLKIKIVESSTKKNWCWMASLILQFAL